MYECNLTLDMPLAEADKAVREALPAEKPGIVSEVDVQGIFRTELNKDMPAYRVLGACNPGLADRLTEQPNAGVRLPCNLVLRADGDNNTVVGFLEPSTLPGLGDAVRRSRSPARPRRCSSASWGDSACSSRTFRVRGSLN